jgi:hypothetical protein
MFDQASDRTYDDDYPYLVKSFSFPDKLPKSRPKPRAFSVEWFKRIANSKPMLPPGLQFGFPINLVRLISNTT